MQIDQPINLALVIGQLSWGGAEKQQLYEMVIRLDRTRFNPTVFCLSEKDYPYGEKLTKQGIKVYTFKRKSNFDLIRLFKLAWLFKKEKIQIVHALLYIAVVYSYFACKLAGIKAFIPSVLGYRKSPSALRKFFDTLALNSAAIVMVNSLDLKDYLVDNLGLDESKIITIFNGIDPDLFKLTEDRGIIKAQLGLPSDSQVVGIISRDAVAKNIPLFIQAAKILAAQKEHLCFVLAGQGLDQTAKAGWLKDFSLRDRFFFLGTRDDIPRILQVFDVLVLTSISEGLPGAIMEAMAARKPVVATNVGGCSELVEDGVSGFLVPSNQPEPLVAAINRVLADKNLAEAFGKRGRRIIEERFSLRQMLKTTQELYIQVLEKA
ncbi:MAG: glycosyltransferase [Candidatus Schekmanbacteria bacterium]|nr:glycosyltransferase [Candidatus Schekmanbacteria bacterium]